MLLVVLYSLLLITGILVSQLTDLAPIRSPLSIATFLCLSYIMIEVGLEFVLNKNKLKEYFKDFAIATTAAVLPWIFSAIYFVVVFHLNWEKAALIGLSSAPTSAGVLFAMLAAAGLGTTWLFQKARVLAIADDIATILLIIPLQIILVGLKIELMFVIIILIFLLMAAYRWLHVLHSPIGKLWLFAYSLAVTTVVLAVEYSFHIHLGVLLPSFALGCILFNPHSPLKEKGHEHTHLEPFAGGPLLFDRLIKATFMFLVGCSLPKVEIGNLTVQSIFLHMVALTFLWNLGKCFPMLCYRQEASLKSRIALGVAMFPRGEVGGGVLLMALSYGFGGIEASLAVLCLALNLLLTGVFIGFVLKLLKNPDSPQRILS